MVIYLYIWLYFREKLSDFIIACAKIVYKRGKIA